MKESNQTTLEYMFRSTFKTIIALKQAGPNILQNYWAGNNTGVEYQMSNISNKCQRGIIANRYPTYVAHDYRDEICPHKH